MTKTTMSLLAAVAHQCWCEGMQDQGWHPGSAYCVDSKTHDALRPFDQLPIADQRRTLRTLRFEETAESLAQLLQYPRDEPGLPELQPEDMRIGRQVTLAEDLRADEGAPKGPGRIISWTINPESGDLDLVRVRWDDGSESEHTPGERELTVVSSLHRGA